MALIKIRNHREPFEVSHIDALKLRNRWLGENHEIKREPNATFSIGESYSGTYSQIEWIKLNPEQPRKDTQPTFADDLLKQFEVTQLQPFLNEKGYLTNESEMDFLKSKNCISLKKKYPDGQNFTASDFDYAVKYEKVEMYIDYSDKIRAWREFKSRMEYGRKQGIADALKDQIASIGK